MEVVIALMILIRTALQIPVVMEAVLAVVVRVAGRPRNNLAI